MSKNEPGKEELQELKKIASITSSDSGEYQREEIIRMIRAWEKKYLIRMDDIDTYILMEIIDLSMKVLSSLNLVSIVPRYDGRKLVIFHNGFHESEFHWLVMQNNHEEYYTLHKDTHGLAEAHAKLTGTPLQVPDLKTKLEYGKQLDEAEIEERLLYPERLGLIQREKHDNDEVIYRHVDTKKVLDRDFPTSPPRELENRYWEEKRYWEKNSPQIERRGGKALHTSATPSCIRPQLIQSTTERPKTFRKNEFEKFFMCHIPLQHAPKGISFLTDSDKKFFLRDCQVIEEGELVTVCKCNCNVADEDLLAVCGECGEIVVIGLCGIGLVHIQKEEDELTPLWLSLKSLQEDGIAALLDYRVPCEKDRFLCFKCVAKKNCRICGRGLSCPHNILNCFECQKPVCPSCVRCNKEYVICEKCVNNKNSKRNGS